MSQKRPLDLPGGRTAHRTRVEVRAAPVELDRRPPTGEDRQAVPGALAQPPESEH